MQWVFLRIEIKRKCLFTGVVMVKGLAHSFLFSVNNLGGLLAMFSYIYSFFVKDTPTAVRVEEIKSEANIKINHEQQETERKRIESDSNTQIAMSKVREKEAEAKLEQAKTDKIKAQTRLETSNNDLAIQEEKTKQKLCEAVIQNTQLNREASGRNQCKSFFYSILSTVVCITGVGVAYGKSEEQGLVFWVGLLLAISGVAGIAYLVHKDTNLSSNLHSSSPLRKNLDDRMHVEEKLEEEEEDNIRLLDQPPGLALVLRK